ncbi:hypothetical protein PHLCEN_2v11041 [Hermanssonia centrifuga]|uniref:Kinesin-like protein n=1 Tax=Hermanssonia centrifuga TaxID=98765 RepID=A0A2R6NL65_9APHY|nr:hypothetical protein PHLCEN_2v11041 [Hermanssonia centrifuga]
MSDLFQLIEDRREDHDVDVIVTFLEIYNEEIRDLLSEPGTPTPRGGLQIREDKSVKVVGLAELRPKNADEVKEIVLLGNSRRTQSPTHANETSSRSHAVLQVHITQSPRTASVTEQRTMATLSIIDLAGSERAAATSNMGQRMVEGANINKSLLALGNCINALCESGGAVRHIPYRNSKLTRLLKFSLGGNCKTVMIVCIAPTSAHFDDTQNTLLYAERATRIKTKVVTRNVLNVDRHVGQYVEAINRLNMQVEDLKAKLAGKRDAEAEKEKRKKVEATAEVQRAKKDMQVKADQTQASLVDGATCSGKLSFAQSKLKVIQGRLTELDVQASTSPLSADLETERGLLRSLASSEEQALKPNSALNTRIQRSNNSGAMFEATLRAVSERRSDKLDELSVDNVKLDARWRKAEMERMKAEASRSALQEAVESQAGTVVSLLGLVGRCTVMLNEASRALATAATDGNDGMEETAKMLAASLKNVADGNDSAFKALLGHTTAEYTIGPAPPSSSALSSFKGYPSTLGLGRAAATAGPTTSQQSQARIARRSSSYGSSMGSSPLRKTYRSPRKSLRSSMAGSVPYNRRVSDKGKKKGVQWRDEVGQGEIDDGGLRLGSAPAIAIIAPNTTIDTSVVTPTQLNISESISPSSSDPFIEPSTSIPSLSTPATGSGSGSGSSLHRSTPTLGPESDWEDEKTEESFSLSFASGLSSSSSSSRARDHLRPLSASTSAAEPRSGAGRRPRASRLDPSFLKSRTRGSTLGSLAETEEERASPRRPSPLSDRNMNRVPSPTASSDGSSSGSGPGKLYIPKGRDRHTSSPAKRVPMTPKIVGSSKSNRRRSNIGPMRIERPRRRSSMIPQLSPKFKSEGGLGGVGDTSVSGARRVAMAERSPAKRAKRASLLAVPTTTVTITTMASRPPSSLKLKQSPVDPNASLSDISFRAGGGSRPTWR